MSKTLTKAESINPDYPYTISEVAHIMKVHPETVKTWYDQGKIGHSRLGHRTVRILGQDIIDFVKNNREEPTSVTQAILGVIEGVHN